MLHTELVNCLLIELSKRKDIRVWKNNTGVLKNDSGEYIRFGLNGSADIIGILKKNGKMICIEVKTGNAVQSKVQKNFEKMILDYNGYYIVGRSIQQVIDFIEKV